ncbi:MAG: tetratricopeptide repeat protein [Bacteroidia bacterium]
MKRIKYALLLILNSSFIIYNSPKAKAQDTIKVKTNLTPEQEAENAYNIALEMMGKKDYNAAIDNFTKAVTLNPTFEKAFLNRGFAKYESKKMANAIEDFNQANVLKPSADAYFGKAECFYGMNKKDSATQNLNKTVALDNRYAKAFYLRGQIKFETKQYKEAIEDYDKAIMAKPDYAYAYNDRGSAKKQLGDEAGAIIDYEKAVQHDNKLFFAYNNLGSAKRNKGDNTGAIEAYNKAIALKPDYYMALNNRGAAKLNKNEIPSAIADFDAALKIKSDYVLAMNNLASAYIKKKEYKTAADWCTKALFIDENAGVCYINRGIARQMLKDEEGACADWKQAAKLGVEIGKNFSSGLCD